MTSDSEKRAAEIARLHMRVTQLEKENEESEAIIQKLRDEIFGKESYHGLRGEISTLSEQLKESERRRSKWDKIHVALTVFMITAVIKAILPGEL